MLVGYHFVIMYTHFHQNPTSHSCFMARSMTPFPPYLICQFLELNLQWENYIGIIFYFLVMHTNFYIMCLEENC